MSIQVFDGDGVERLPNASKADYTLVYLLCGHRQRLAQLLDMHIRGEDLMPHALFELVELLDNLMMSLGGGDLYAARLVRNEVWLLWRAKE